MSGMGLGWISEKGSVLRELLDTGSPGSGHGPKAAGAPRAFGQCSQRQGGIVGVSWAGAGVEVSDPCGSPPTQDILILGGYTLTLLLVIADTWLTADSD